MLMLLEMTSQASMLDRLSSALMLAFQTHFVVRLHSTLLIAAIRASSLFAQMALHAS
jgi:hypothetical protein